MASVSVVGLPVAGLPAASDRRGQGPIVTPLISHPPGTLRFLAQALARGKLSYAKVRALTLVAAPARGGKKTGTGSATPPTGEAVALERIGSRSRQRQIPRSG